MRKFKDEWKSGSDMNEREFDFNDATYNFVVDLLNELDAKDNTITTLRSIIRRSRGEVE
jgi:hypothetical protein